MRLRTSFALLLGSGLVLSGCGSDEPVPKFAPAPTATPPGATPPGATPPSATPTVVEEETAEDETAEEFIRRWNDEQREMQKGDTSEYRRIAGECESCMKAADQVDEIYDAGGFVKTDGRTVRSIRLSQRSNDAEYVYLVRLDSAPTVYRESAEASKRSYAGGTSAYELRLSKRAGEWTLLDTWAVHL